jgi:hypothetical protein
VWNFARDNGSGVADQPPQAGFVNPQAIETGVILENNDSKEIRA